MANGRDFLLGLLAGAGIMYLLDPIGGARRRSLARDKMTHYGRELGARAGAEARHAANHARGAIAEARARLTPDDADDRIVHERVRAELGHHVSNPHAVSVDVRDGAVTLSGPVLAGEAEALTAAVRTVRGVRLVQDRLDMHDAPRNEPALQAHRGDG